MRKAWTDDGWADYVYWQTEDKRTLKKINSLIKSTIMGPAQFATQCVAILKSKIELSHIP